MLHKEFVLHNNSRSQRKRLRNFQQSIAFIDSREYFRLNCKDGILKIAVVV